MKKSGKVILTSLVFLVVFIGSAFTSEKEEIERYISNIAKGSMIAHMKSEGNFRYVIVPTLPQLIIAFNYPKYLEKRYTKEQIMEEVKGILAVKESILIGTFVIHFTGDWQSKGKTEKEIPEDFAEYLFLENDRGDFVRCSKADIPLFNNTVGIFNESLGIMLEFPLYFEKDGKRVSILEDTEYIEFVVGGLGFKENRFRFYLPLYKITEDTPRLLRELFTELGLTEYPPK